VPDSAVFIALQTPNPKPQTPNPKPQTSEVFRHELYNHKVDQYSFAMIAYQVRCLSFPAVRGLKRSALDLVLPAASS